MKVPKARRQSSGKWYIYLRLGGQQISVTENTERACIKAAQLIKAEYLNGKRFEKPEEITLSQALDRYISARSNVLSPSTIRGYRNIQNTRFLDAQKQPLSKLDWQQVVNDEAKRCGPKTLRNAWGLISGAVLDQTGSHPRVTLPQVVRHEHPFLTPEQINTFCAAVRGDPVEIPALLGLCSLRCSEVLGLQWKHVDLDAGVIRVRGAAVKDERGVVVRKDANKNTTSNRDVPILMPQLAAALQAAPPHKPEDPVVTYSARGLLARVNTVCRHCSLPEVGMHGLRHSFASLAYHLNVPYKVTMQIAGWKDDATMRRIYTHVGQASVTAAASAMTEFFSSPPGSP